MIGYYEEMAHCFVYDSGVRGEASVGFYETLGMMIGGETTLRAAYNPYIETVITNNYQTFSATTSYYLEHDDGPPGVPEMYACGFRGLLMSAKEGKISPEEAVDQIERSIKSAKSSIPFLPHRWTLRTIETYNPDLNFRNRNLDELIAELDRSIQDAVEGDVAIRKHAATQALKGIERYFILGLALTALALQILSIVF